jgi:(R,R)-butanediol dehydrogenase/meso-butanediol dehydrogenase/diacetyl reductase
MQVGLVTGKRTIELREMPEPTPEAHKAVVDIAYCGVCGTDLHAYASGAPYNPAICGHEWGGVVRAVAPDVANVKEGDRVGIGVAPACGQCEECRRDDAAHCSAVLIGMLGLGPLAPPHGGFARSIAIEAARLVPLRDGVSDEQAGVLEPATVALHAVRRTPMQRDDSALVLGAGPIGLLTLQCARAAGAARVVVVEPNASRAELARRVGADAVLDPTREDLRERVRAECGARGPDVVFECAGIPQTIDQSAEFVRRGGVISLVGLANEPAQISPGTWLAKEVHLVASLGTLHEEFAMAQELILDGRLQIDPLITSKRGLSELSLAFDSLLAPEGEIKVLIDPRD